MNLHKLNQLIQTAQSISDEQLNGTMDSKLNEKLASCLDDIKSEYGRFLEEKLFEIYDDYFSDEEIKPLEQYLITAGVEVESDELDDLKSLLVIRPFPLRFEAVGINKQRKQIVWQTVDSNPLLSA